MQFASYHRFTTAAVAAAMTAGALSAQRLVTGERDGISWVAQSRIVGVGSTDLTTAGGDPRYTVNPAASGVVQLLIETAAGNFSCSGTLLPDRQSILTAAHCVSDGAGTANPTRTLVIFPGTTDVDATILADPASRGREVSEYRIHPNYTGEVIDQNDIAVLRLSEPAPASAIAYGIDRGTSLTGENFEVQGYGRRSSVGGNVGDDLGTGVLRRGFNRYEFRFGDDDWGDFFTARDGTGQNFFGRAEVAFSYVSDFDNGVAANDGSCSLGTAFGLGGPKYCNLGLGADEVGIAGGDSGGPNFLRGLIAGVNSYSLSFGTGFGDIRAGLNNSFGELDGYVPTYIHADWIDAQVVPEPSTYALMATGLVGLGMMARRRRKA